MTVRAVRPPRRRPGLRLSLLLWRWLWIWHHDAALLLHVAAGEIVAALLIALVLRGFGLSWSLGAPW